MNSAFPSVLPITPRHRRVWAEIDTTALAANYRGLVARVHHDTPEALPIAVVKADAYGHGVRPVLDVLLREGCRSFAVACIDEAITVRRAVRSLMPALPDRNVLILILGYTHPADAAHLAQDTLTATFLSADHARALSRAAVSQGVTVNGHIALDTGMNRIGLVCRSVAEINRAVADIEAMSALPGLRIKGLFSHFACADEEDDVASPDSRTGIQYARYRAVLTRLEADGYRPPLCHVCNSAASIRFPGQVADGCMDAFRLGIGLYGYGIAASCNGACAFVPRPVMRLKTLIVHMHELLPGEPLGYGGAYVSDKPRSIATLSVGYADGFLRAFTGASVVVHTASGDFETPIVGRICMDQCMIDVTDLPVAPGDTVTLFGAAPDSLLELCARAHTIPYEILCLITARVPRVSVE